ncbi:SDR family oxidoreductase [Streptomyces sp. NPDC005573]|uniref:SDR family oxidoreductase n=1 Tax=Streptomyces sp. NPDC005573 TaxID=3156890 RepID=UPI0033A4BE59
MRGPVTTRCSQCRGGHGLSDRHFVHGRRPGLSAYAASKAAVSVLPQAAARECIADGIRINAVSPGASDTPMSYRTGETKTDRDNRVAAAVPAGRVSDPAEVATA